MNLLPCSDVEISPMMPYTFNRTILKHTAFLLRKIMFFPLRRKEKKIETIFVKVFGIISLVTLKTWGAQ